MSDPIRYEKGLSPNPANSGVQSALSGKTTLNDANTIPATVKTPDSAAHTPLPWHVETVTDEDGNQFWSDDWNGKVFCICHPQTVCNASTVVEWINKADAAFIVRACNSHYQLVEALRLALRVAESWAHDQLDGTGSLTSALAELEPCRAALSQATGEA